MKHIGHLVHCTYRYLSSWQHVYTTKHNLWTSCHSCSHNVKLTEHCTCHKYDRKSVCMLADGLESNSRVRVKARCHGMHVVLRSCSEYQGWTQNSLLYIRTSLERRWVLFPQHVFYNQPWWWSHLRAPKIPRSAQSTSRYDLTTFGLWPLPLMSGAAKHALNDTRANLLLNGSQRHGPGEHYINTAWETEQSGKAQTPRGISLPIRVPGKNFTGNTWDEAGMGGGGGREEGRRTTKHQHTSHFCNARDVHLSHTVQQCNTRLQPWSPVSYRNPNNWDLKPGRSSHMHLERTENPQKKERAVMRLFLCLASVRAVG